MENTGNIRINSSEMGERTDWEGLEPVPVKYAYSGLIFTVVFFQIVNKIITGKGAPKYVQTDFWKWKNLYISWIHAVICSLWDISCFVLYPEMMQDLVAYHNMHIYGMIVFSSGYFVYDFMDIWIHKQAANMWEVLVHHVAVSGMFIYNLFISRCLAYNCIALLIEINSVFLHTRKLFQMCGVDYNSTIYKVNKWLNLVTFFVFRFGCLIVIMIGMYYWRHRVTFAYYAFLTCSMTVMGTINVVLFWRLIKSDVLRESKGTTKLKCHTNGVSSTNNNLNDNNENSLKEKKQI